MDERFDESPLLRRHPARDIGRLPRLVVWTEPNQFMKFGHRDLENPVEGSDRRSLDVSVPAIEDQRNRRMGNLDAELARLVGDSPRGQAVNVRLGDAVG